MKLTCEDCIHYGICIFHLKGNENKDCLHFKADAMKWIPVTERLPESGGLYLVYKERYGMFGATIGMASFTACYDGFEEHLQGKKNLWYRYDSEVGDYEVSHITHWMPLPEPPKEEEG